LLKLTNRYYYIVIFGFLSSNVFKYHVFFGTISNIYIYIYSFVDIWICIILIIYYDFIVVILLRYQ
jgi:hypothetical protein